MSANMMADPSGGVPQQILPHVHLISSFKYPVLARLNPDQAVDHLLNAPRIVKELAPMAWMYLQTPSDGSVFLEWTPPRQGAGRFASDGYIWADPEFTFNFEVKGYHIEAFVHRSGFRLGTEHVALHSRSRYRIVAKDDRAPGVIDPCLWIVHYTQAEPQYRFPVHQVSIQPYHQTMIRERQFLEQQGQLVRKEFMLADRQSWPTVSFSMGQPGGMFPGGPMHMGMQRPPQFFPGNQGLAGPPAKRPRVGGPPSQMPGVGPGGPALPAGVPHDSSIEDEESYHLGDLLDHLTPRELSQMRYQQHHEWMEEVFSSPYGAGQIVPVDLGQGLTGELAEITEGILDAPGIQSQNPAEKSANKTYKKLDAEQLQEFESRVAKYIEKGESELLKMKEDHAKRIADIKRSKAYTKGERRLRATSDAVDANGYPEGGEVQRPKETLDDVVHDVQSILGVSIAPRKEAICREKGGLQQEEKREVNGNGAAAKSEANGDMTVNMHGINGVDGANDSNGLTNMLQDDSLTLDADNTTAGLLDQFANTSYANTPGTNTNLSIPQASASHPASQAVTPSGAGNLPDTSEFPVQSGLHGVPEGQDNSALDLMEGMDLDVDMLEGTGDLEGTGGLEETGGIEGPVTAGLAGADDSTKPAEPDDWVMVDQSGGTANPTTGAADTSATTSDPQQAAQKQQQQQPPSTDQAAGEPPSTEQPPLPTAEEPTQDEAAGDSSMFDSADFSAFDTLGGGAGEAGDMLEAYGGHDDDDLGLGLDDSAFGEAFHATEQHGDEGGA